MPPRYRRKLDTITCRSNEPHHIHKTSNLYQNSDGTARRKRQVVGSTILGLENATPLDKLDSDKLHQNKRYLSSLSILIRKRSIINSTLKALTLNMLLNKLPELELL